MKNPGLLSEGLVLVGRQNETQGGPLDLLGIDADGRLVVFELKRGTLTRDAVAQVLDYVSYLNELGEDARAQHIQANSGRFGIDRIDDFCAWYQERFSGAADAFLQTPRAVLVGLGVDERARRMVEFLALRGIDISLLTFYGFKDGNDLLLARQVNIAPQEVKDAMQAALPGSYVWPNATCYGIYLPEQTENGRTSNRNYVSVYVDAKRPGAISLWWQERAIKHAGEAIDTAASTVGGKPRTPGKGYLISLTPELWKRSKELWIAAAYAAWTGYAGSRNEDGSPAARRG